MNSFKCYKCSYNTIRNYDLTRHLKRVHGITKIKESSDERSELPGKEPMSEDYRKPSCEISQQSIEEPNKDSEARSITEEEYRSLGLELKTTKCRILDSVLDTLPDHLKTKAKCICDILKRFDFLFVNSHHEIYIRWTETERIKHSRPDWRVIKVLSEYSTEYIRVHNRRNFTYEKIWKKRVLKTRRIPRVGESSKSKKCPAREHSRITKFETMFEDPETYSEDDWWPRRRWHCWKWRRWNRRRWDEWTNQMKNE